MPIKTTPTRFIPARGADGFDDSLAATSVRGPAPAGRDAPPAQPGRPAPQTVRMTGMSRTGF